MGLFDRLFGKKTPAPAPGQTPSPTNQRSSSDDENRSIGIIVVFPQKPTYSAETLKRTLAGLDRSLAGVTVESIEGSAEQGTPITRLSWGQHVVDTVGMEVPMPAGPMKNCVDSAYYSQEIKKQVIAHRAHAILFYNGSDPSVLERFTALFAVSAAMGKLGALAVLNESALTSLPTAVLVDLATDQPNLQVLRQMPLLLLSCGFTKYFRQGTARVWVRTYNCPVFGLPDLAMEIADTNQSQNTFDMFSSLLAYLLDSGARFAPGHTAQLGDAHMRFRAPRDDEPFPTDTAGQLLIIEKNR